MPTRNLRAFTITWAVVCSVAATSWGQTPTSYWSLNNTSNGVAVDSLGGNNGVWQNGVSTNLAQVSGFVGGAAGLNDLGGAAANNFFQIASLNQLNGAAGVTIAAWIDPSTNGSYDGIFMTRDFNNQTNNSWGLAIEGAAGVEHLDSRVNGPGIDSANGSLSPSAGWMHVALTWNGATQTHTQFVNGVQTASTATAIGPTIAGATNGPWFIGYDNCCGNGRDFNGTIDEAAVWNQALTPSQIAQVYSAGLNNIAASDAFTATAPLSGTIQQGLVGSWNMDQAAGSPAAGDAINGNNAVLTNMANTTAWVGGQVGRALDFDGSNDQAIISGIPQINNSDAMTISLWVRNDGGNEGYEGIFQHRSADNTNQQGLMTPSNSTVAAGNPANDAMARIGNTASIITTPAGALPTDGSWTHIVQTYKQGEIHEMYIDGVLAAGGPTAANVPIISNGAWRFGNDVCCGNRFFDGGIDDAGLWNRVLTTSEIAAVREAGLNGISHTRAFVPENGSVQQGLVGHWTLDQARFHPTANDSLASADAVLSSVDTGSAWSAGQIGGALQFDGSNDQAVISGTAATQLNAALNGSTALTMSLWVRSDGSNNNNEGLFVHRDSTLTGLNTPSVGTDNFDFRINSASLKSDDNTLLNGQWQHVVGVWEANERFEIWIDGVLSESGAAPGGTLAVSGDWRFGNDACCGNRFFEGAIDDAALWDRALDAGEIMGLYLDGLESLNAQQAQAVPAAVPEPATFALWAILGSLTMGIAYRRRHRAR